MPFPGHHHSSSSSSQHNVVPSQAGAATGIFQAAQTLGSIGAPAGNLRVATSGTTSAGTDALYPASGNAPGLNSGGQTVSPVSSGLQGPGAATSSSAPMSAVPHQSSPFETSRPTQTFN